MKKSEIFFGKFQIFKFFVKKLNSSPKSDLFKTKTYIFLPLKGLCCKNRPHFWTFEQILLRNSWAVFYLGPSNKKMTRKSFCSSTYSRFSGKSPTLSSERTFKRVHSPNFVHGSSDFGQIMAKPKTSRICCQEPNVKVVGDLDAAVTSASVALAPCKPNTLKTLKQTKTPFWKRKSQLETSWQEVVGKTTKT